MEYKDISAVRKAEEKLLLLLKDTDEFPSERKISEELDISRSVLRSAIHHLESENALVRVNGKLKSNKMISIGLLGNGSMSRELQMDNRNSEIIEYSKEIVEVSTKKIQKFFKLEKGSKLIRLIRFRRNNGVPISYEVAYMDYQKFPKIMDVNFDDKSLYKTLEKYYSIKVAYGREEISCVKSDDDKSSVLEIPLETPLFKVSSYNYDDEDNPVEHTDQYLAGDKFKYILSAKNIFDYKEDE
ncbi:GntR family transcriptional regulator [Companilactobacillus muriivasis]|uniref:GntR family transcriptional regulator n=1 Tax=Companilactobacillus muriivasis TaxID=3081444 RepID=UPI0030C68AD2